MPLSPLSLKRYKLPHLREGQKPDAALAVSISGGGSRAMCFGIGVLIGLEEIKAGDSDLLNEVDYFSTVSGGGFAAGYYLARKYHYLQVAKDSVPPFSFLNIWNNSVRQKSLLPNVNLSTAPFKNIFLYNSFTPRARSRSYYQTIKNDVMFTGEKDNLATLSALKHEKDRKAFNSSITHFNAENLIDKLYLSDFYIPNSEQKKLSLPIIITNGTLYQNNARMGLVPYLFDTLGWLDFFPHTRLREDKPARKYGQRDMPLYYTITASAAFPGVLPQMRGTRPEKEEIRIVDGGVGDNFGYKSVFDVFNELNSTSEYRALKKRLIVIDASGIGLGSPYAKREKLSIFKIAGKQLFSVLESKYPDAIIELEEKQKSSADNNFKYAFLGITTIRKYCDLEKQPNSLKSNTRVKWNDLFESFMEYMSSTGIKYANDLQPSDVVKSPEALWLLYELAAHVETKLKVNSKERAILVLAGRTIVYLKREELGGLLD